MLTISSLGYAQAQALTPVSEDEGYPTSQDLERFAQAATVVASLDDPCSKQWTFSHEIVRYETETLVRITNVNPKEQYRLVGPDGVLYAGEAGVNGTVTKVVSDGEINVFATDACGKEVIAKSFSTEQPSANDPMVVDRPQYDAIIAWQNSGETMTDFFSGYAGLDHFSKVSVVQNLLYNGLPLRNEFLTAGRMPGKKDLKEDNIFKMDNCQCRRVEISMVYLLSPIDRIRGDGRISGIYGSRTDQRFRGGDIRADQYWAIEGPARYQELFAGTWSKKCAKAPYTIFWGERGASDIPPEDRLLMQNTASIEYNWVCFDANEAISDCGCDRTVAFDWNYESVVKANAAIKKGGSAFCGSNKTAIAEALDLSCVSFMETNDASTFELLAIQPNGTFSTCSQSYEGPSLADVLKFVYTVYKATKGPPQVGGDPQSQAIVDEIWNSQISSSILGQVDDAFDEDWISSTPCDQSLSGTRRTYQQTGKNTRHVITMSPNNPIKIMLSSGGALSGGGLRRWTANASIYSSFRLAGIMQGGGSPVANAPNDCCSPYVNSWLLSTVAADSPLPGNANEGVYQNETEGFFNVFNYNQNVWSETGNRSRYPSGFACPSPVGVEVTDPSLTGGSLDEDFKIYTTPGEITIIVTDYLLGEKSVKFGLFNVSGQELTNGTIRKSPSLKLQTANLPAGIYFLRAMAEDNSIATKKIIIQ